MNCDCIASGNPNKPKQHGADPHAKNCAVYTTPSVRAQAEQVIILLKEQEQYALRVMRNVPLAEVCHEAWDILQILSQLTAREPQGWQDIATAPKDGTRILGFWGHDPYNAHPGIFTARYFKDHWCDESLHRFNEPGLTHWMPLPNPPITRSLSSPPSGE